MLYCLHVTGGGHQDRHRADRDQVSCHPQEVAQHTLDREPTMSTNVCKDDIIHDTQVTVLSQGSTQFNGGYFTALHIIFPVSYDNRFTE